MGEKDGPMKWRATIAVASFLAVLPALAFGRGGGGCLEKGSSVLTPSGPVAVEYLNPGDSVCSFSDGSIIAAKVQAVIDVAAEEYCEISIGGNVLRLTAEHPVATAAGVFRIASALRPGDRVLMADRNSVTSGVVKSVRQVPAGKRAYNLLVSPGGNYVANGIVVHNKGCFLPETLIRKEDGAEIPISGVRPKDCVLAFTLAGEAVSARVRSVVTHEVDEYEIVTTRRITVHVTAEHPFYVGNGTFKTIEALKVGDCIFTFDGEGLRGEAIESITTIHERVLVYNLQTDSPNTFLANGFLVHNKGGGGGGGGFHGGGFHGGSRSSTGSDSTGLVGAMVFILIVVGIGTLLSARQQHNENLDFVYSPSMVARKSGKTIKLLEFLAKQDPAMAPEALRRQTEATFLKLQQCWTARNYEPMRPLMMPDLFQNHSLQIAGMVRQHEINIIGDLRIDRIDLVNVRYTFKEEQREFTALITATACDYYVDDRTSKRLRGDKAPAQFQEFWTFQLHNKAWLLRDVEQTRESDALKEENFFEQFTDTGVAQIYGKEATKEGQAGPWLEKAAGTKETRIERMLNFLAQTDMLWDRQTMTETARRVFLEMMAARESGDPAKVPDGDLFPEVAADLKEEISRNKAEGAAREFRNLCVRKVELVLVRNFADNSRDEFVARVRAHAQRILRRKGRVTWQDQDVVPFEQYLTLGRLEKRWRLKEILSAEAGQAAVKEENLDQDSSPEQVQWYYQHSRAN
jgi:predicted lipid-binding transport protein (Tim44 family)